MENVDEGQNYEHNLSKRSLDEALPDAPVVSPWDQIKAICIMSVLWSSSSVVKFTLIIMNKSFQGTIYLNYYLDAVSNIVAILIVG